MRLLLLLLAFIGNFPAEAQGKNEETHSNIYFVRSGNFIGSACVTTIDLPNQKEFVLNVQSTVKFEVYSTGEIPLTVRIDCPPTEQLPASSSTRQIMLEVERGKEYYVFYNRGMFEQKEKHEIEKHIKKSRNEQYFQENREFPIDRNSILSTAKKTGKGQGTAFLIDDNGYFITNYHCIQDAVKVNILGISDDFSHTREARIVASDPSNDLALLKLVDEIVLPKPPYGLRAEGVEQAERIYALGYPIVEALGAELKITDGIISAKSGSKGDISKYQISAPVNSGNSGGPLIDENGNLIGVIYAKSTVAESAGYAVKGSYLETFLKNIDTFSYAGFIETMGDIPFSKKVAAWKQCIFIVEAEY